MSHRGGVQPSQYKKNFQGWLHVRNYVMIDLNDQLEMNMNVSNTTYKWTVDPLLYKKNKVSTQMHM